MTSKLEKAQKVTLFLLFIGELRPTSAELEETRPL